MAKVHVTHMTEGSPLKLLVLFAVPLLIGNLFQQMYNLADSMIVGKLLGADALAAVGSTGSISFFFFSIFNGLSGGSGIITAQIFGAGDPRRVKLAIANTAYLTGFAALITAAAGYLAAPFVLRFLQTPEKVLPDAVTYMRVTCLSVPMMAVYNYTSSMQRALGDSKTPLFFLIVSCVLNIGMDYLFVGFFGMGVFGAALATALAQLLAGLGSLLYAIRINEYFRLSKAHFRINRDIILSACKIGLPLSLQWAMIAVSTTALQRVANSFGTVVMAAYTATCRLEQVVQQPFGSFSTGLSTFVGQNYGAKKMERVHLGFRSSLMLMTVVALFMMGIMQVFSHQLMHLFVNDGDVIALGGRALRITSFFYVFLGLIYMCRGVLNGVGDGLFAFINGIIEIIGRIGLPLLLIQGFGMNEWSIWWTAGLTWVLAGTACALRYLTWNKRMKRETSVS